MAHTLKVLSIDGGGIRGIIPATVLSYIEQKTGKPISGLFDLVAGTSTGGILTVGLTKPNPSAPDSPQYSANDLLAFYERDGATVFPNSTSLCRLARQLVRPKYSVRGLEAVLGRLFAGGKLSESLTNVLVTAYDIERRAPFFFKSMKAKSAPTGENLDFRLEDVARSTAAAPTYFAPARVATLNFGTQYALIDGGVIAGNPAMCAFAEAKKRLVRGDDDILLVSLGTGKCEGPIRYDRAKKWGALQWALPLLEVSLGGSDATVDYQLQRLVPRGNYFRFQKKLEVADHALDNATPANIQNLKLEANKLVTANQTDLDRLCKLLVDHGQTE